MAWLSTPAWEDTKRYPGAKSNGHQKIANTRTASVAKTLKNSSFEALTNATDFDQFTSQAWRPYQPVKACSSLEGNHNTIHDYTGTDDTVIQKSP